MTYMLGVIQLAERMKVDNFQLEIFKPKNVSKKLTV